MATVLRFRSHTTYEERENRFRSEMESYFGYQYNSSTGIVRHDVNNRDVKVTYQKMKTGGLRVKLASDYGKYTLGEYQRKISFSTIRKHIHEMFNPNTPKMEKTKTKKARKTTTTNDNYLDLTDILDDYYKKAERIRQAIMDRFNCEHYSSNQNSAGSSWVYIPLQGDNNVTVYMESHGRSWHANWCGHVRVVVQVPTTKVKRCGKNGRYEKKIDKKVMETPKGKINMGSIFNELEEYVREENKRIVDEKKAQKKRELNLMVFRGTIKRMIPEVKLIDIKHNGYSDVPSTSIKTYSDLDTKKPIESDHSYSNCVHISKRDAVKGSPAKYHINIDSSLNLSQEQLSKFLQGLHNLGLLNRKGN